MHSFFNKQRLFPIELPVISENCNYTAAITHINFHLFKIMHTVLIMFLVNICILCDALMKLASSFFLDFEFVILKKANVAIKGPEEIPHQIRITWQIWTLAN